MERLIAAVVQVSCAIAKFLIETERLSTRLCPGFWLLQMIEEETPPLAKNVLIPSLGKIPSIDYTHQIFIIPL